MEQQSFQRHVATKIRIGDILSGTYKVDGNAPNFLESNGKEISRVNVVAAVTQASSDGYANFTIEDGTGNISLRSFEPLNLASEIVPGDIINIIGKPREYNSEKYILIEILRKIDAKWVQVRGLEIGNSASQTVEEPEIDSTEEVVSLKSENSGTSELLQKIKELDQGEGVALEDLSSQDINDVDSKVDMLLKEGDIFEVKPGRIKVLE